MFLSPSRNSQLRSKTGATLNPKSVSRGRVLRVGCSLCSGCRIRVRGRDMVSHPHRLPHTAAGIREQPVEPVSYEDGGGAGVSGGARMRAAAAAGNGGAPKEGGRWSEGGRRAAGDGRQAAKDEQLYLTGLAMSRRPSSMSSRTRFWIPAFFNLASSFPGLSLQALASLICSPESRYGRRHRKRQ